MSLDSFLPPESPAQSHYLRRLFRWQVSPTHHMPLAAALIKQFSLFPHPRLSPDRLCIVKSNHPALVLYPRKCQLLHPRGLVVFGAEDYFSAIRALETALSKDNKPPRQHLIQLMLGVSHWNSGNSKAAKEDFENLLSKNPNSPTEMLVQDYLAELELDEGLYQ